MENVKEILSKLNEEQLKPVVDTDGAVLVIAGAGSGKTRVLTSRIAYLVLEKNVDPSNIMAITFTNKAAGEMKERLQNFIGDLGDILPENPNGAILFTKPGSEDILQNYVDNEYKEVLLRHWFTNDTLVSELYNPLTSKAQALEKIRKYYNIDKQKTIAFGDGHNDIEMLEFCHIAVAMENSHPDLLKVCTHTTKTVHESGVAHFFKTHIF